MHGGARDDASMTNIRMGRKQCKSEGATVENISHDSVHQMSETFNARLNTPKSLALRKGLGSRNCKHDSIT